MAEAIVFYSWQSDLPNNTNRSLIETALRAAVAAVKAEGELTVEPVFDRDTQGLPGAPDINSAIFDKIDGAAAFVCDVSLINQGGLDRRLTPNPNVLVELGYALRALSWERIVMVLNLDSGVPEDLPFDLNRRRVLTYRSAKADAERAPARNSLKEGLVDALRTILQHPLNAPPAQPTIADKTYEALENGGPRAAAAVEDYMEHLAGQVATANARPRTGELLVQAIDALTADVLDFVRLASEVASRGEQSLALAMHRGFGPIIQQYRFPPRVGGSFYETDFDLPKFIRHELFTSFAALMIKRGHLGLLGEALREPLLIDDSDGKGLRHFGRVSEQVRLVSAYYEQKVQSGQRLLSPQGELLKSRHGGDSVIARQMPWRLFVSADYFLYLFAQIAGDRTSSSPWVPWSFLYMLSESPPDWLSGARSRRRFDDLCRAFGLTTDEFRKRYGEVGMRAGQYFPGAFAPNHLLPNPDDLGSVP